MFPCLKLWVYVKQSMASNRIFTGDIIVSDVHRTAYGGCPQFFKLLFAAGDLIQQRERWRCICIWHAVFGMLWQKKPNCGQLGSNPIVWVYICRKLIAACTSVLHLLQMINFSHLQSKIALLPGLGMSWSSSDLPQWTSPPGRWTRVGVGTEAFSPSNQRRLFCCFECHSLGRTTGKTDS